MSAFQGNLFAWEKAKAGRATYTRGALSAARAIAAYQLFARQSPYGAKALRRPRRALRPPAPRQRQRPAAIDKRCPRCHCHVIHMMTRSSKACAPARRRKRRAPPLPCETASYRCLPITALPRQYISLSAAVMDSIAASSASMRSGLTSSSSSSSALSMPSKPGLSWSVSARSFA